ncbi:hypothetical protein V5O48_011312 [Marasmius crinis-equi]|uniref:Yeast cell wall synthesis Kre9/Knh1-like N-terminal domain-containing protein n=1 Tax=Marasmius crinis-equi TaxID=585013 RepID=A0ABR3F640_9AGAR
MLFFKTAILASFTSCAFATVFITSPTADTTFEAGKKATITWTDSKDAPAIAQWGNAKVSIHTGNANQQTQLQQLAASVDVSKINTIEFTPDASIGPNGNDYFIRVESLSLKDPKNPQFPALAFSAKFKLSGMTGKFSAEIQAQIDGQSTAPIGGSTSATGGSKTTSPASAATTPSLGSGTTSKPASTSGSASVAAASSSPTDNAGTRASGIPAAGFTIWTAVLGGVAAGALFL